MSDDPRAGFSELPLPLARQVDEILNRFEVDCKNGRRLRLEDVLGEINEAGRSVLLRELLVLDIAYRKRQGDTPTAEECRTRFPTLDAVWLSKKIAAAPAPTGKAAGASSHTPIMEKAASDSSPTNRIRCPQCHNPLQLNGQQSDEVLCPGCGGSFRVREAKYTDTSSGMKQMGKFQLLEARASAASG